MRASERASGHFHMGNHMEIHAQHVFIADCGKRYSRMKGLAAALSKNGSRFPRNMQSGQLGSDTSSRLKELQDCFSPGFPPCFSRPQMTQNPLCRCFLTNTVSKKDFFFSFGLLGFSCRPPRTLCHKGRQNLSLFLLNTRRCPNNSEQEVNCAALCRSHVQHIMSGKKSDFFSSPSEQLDVERICLLFQKVAYLALCLQLDFFFFF